MSSTDYQELLAVLLWLLVQAKEMFLLLFQDLLFTGILI
jgi:hypothetical protein